MGFQLLDKVSPLMNPHNGPVSWIGVLEVRGNRQTLSTYQCHERNPKKNPQSMPTDLQPKFGLALG